MTQLTTFMTRMSIAIKYLLTHDSNQDSDSSIHSLHRRPIHEAVCAQGVEQGVRGLEKESRGGFWLDANRDVGDWEWARRVRVVEVLKMCFHDY